MHQVTINPPLLVQKQRKLDKHRIVVSGPTGYNARWIWTLAEGKQVTIYPVHQPSTTYCAVIDRPNMSVLSPNEMFGFDPVTSRSPLLKRTQQYNSLVLRCDDHDFVGSIVAPIEPALQVSSVHATVVLNLPPTVDDNYLKELATNTETDRFVWRYEGKTTGYVIVDFSVLLKQSPQKVDISMIHLASEGLCQQCHLHGMLPQRLESRGDISYSEIIVGEAKVDTDGKSI